MRPLLRVLLSYRHLKRIFFLSCCHMSYRHPCCAFYSFSSDHFLCQIGLPVWFQKFWLIGLPVWVHKCWFEIECYLVFAIGVIRCATFVFIDFQLQAVSMDDLKQEAYNRFKGELSSVQVLFAGLGMLILSVVSGYSFQVNYKTKHRSVWISACDKRWQSPHLPILTKSV